LFVGAVINVNPSRVVSILFIVAMTSLIIGLGCFLREISLSVHIFDLSKDNALNYSDNTHKSD